jgi:predicted nucleic acid-binding Zn ribbon protein
MIWHGIASAANRADDRGGGQGRQRHHRLRRVRAHDDGQDGRAGRPGRAAQGVPHHRPGRQRTLRKPTATNDDDGR